MMMVRLVKTGACSKYNNIKKGKDNHGEYKTTLQRRHQFRDSEGQCPTTGMDMGRNGSFVTDGSMGVHGNGHGYEY